MAQTPEGAIKMRATMIAKYGSEKAWKAHMSEMAIESQQAWETNGRKPRGFALSRERARLAGAKGGRISRRVSNKQEN